MSPIRGGGSTPLPLKKFFNVKKTCTEKPFSLKKNSVGDHLHEISGRRRKPAGRKALFTDNKPLPAPHSHQNHEIVDSI